VSNPNAHSLTDLDSLGDMDTNNHAYTYIRADIYRCFPAFGGPPKSRYMDGW
jgi:hypothetical protein